jgi:hypothetical protein
MFGGLSEVGLDQADLPSFAWKISSSSTKRDSYDSHVGQSPFLDPFGMLYLHFLSLIPGSPLMAGTFFCLRSSFISRVLRVWRDPLPVPAGLEEKRTPAFDR